MGRVQFAFRVARSSSVRLMFTSWVSALIVIWSPSLMRAIGPPSKASGVIWPTTNPWVPPENLPSVIRATSVPSP